MEEVTVKAPHMYAGKRRQVGERYSAEEKFIPALRHLGWLEPSGSPAKPPEKKPKKLKLVKARK